MPFYTYLKLRESDKPEHKAWKRRTASRLVDLRAALNNHIYGNGRRNVSVHDRNDARWLRIATWNIREFDTLKYGGRLTESLYYIAEIISHFDLVALQEVREDLGRLNAVIRILGKHDWSYIATDVTEGRPGNRERMVFVYNNHKVRFTNIAGEITLAEREKITSPYHNGLHDPSGLRLELPPETGLSLPQEIKTRKSGDKVKLSEDLFIDLPERTKMMLPSGSRLLLKKGMEVMRDDNGVRVLPDDLSAPFFCKDATLLFSDDLVEANALQFARTPFLVTFQSGWLKFILCTVHIYYGSGSEGLARRNQEIRRLTKFLAERAKNENDSDAENFFFVLGDFNIVGKDHSTWESLHSNGFFVPPELQEIPEGSNVKRDKAYDQIAYWKRSAGMQKEGVRIDVGNAGIFDFFKYVFRAGDNDPDKEDERCYAGKVSETKLPYPTWRTYQMSDHLPMWLELRIDFSDDYLGGIAEAE